MSSYVSHGTYMKIASHNRTDEDFPSFDDSQLTCSHYLNCAYSGGRQGKVLLVLYGRQSCGLLQSKMGVGTAVSAFRHRGYKPVEI